MVFLISTMLLIVHLQKEDFSNALTPPEIRADRYHYYNKRVQVCGDTIGQNGQLSLLEFQNGLSTTSIAFDRKIYVKRVSGRFCIKGIIKRFDGLTIKQAQKQGKSYVFADTPFDPQYIVRP